MKTTAGANSPLYVRLLALLAQCADDLKVERYFGGTMFLVSGKLRKHRLALLELESSTSNDG